MISSESLAASVAVYRRNGALYMQGSNETLDGLAIASYDDLAVIEDPTVEALEAALFPMLDRCRTGMPRLTGAQVDAMPPSPLPALAGVRSWRAFVTGTRIVTVIRSRSGSIELRRLRPAGDMMAWVRTEAVADGTAAAHIAARVLAMLDE